MADLFTITAPLLVRFPDGTRHVMVELFPHPRGLVYFRPFWDRLPPAEGIRLLQGSTIGEGPWKIGDAVITLLGCQGTNPDEVAEYAGWEIHREALGDRYPGRAEQKRLALEAFPDPGELGRPAAGDAS